MSTANPKVVEAVTAALIERLEADESGYVADDGDGDYRVDVYVNLPKLVADMVEIGQTPVDRVLAAWQRSRRALVIPDREELAFELFNADNSRQQRSKNWIDWTGPGMKRHYAYVMADAAIEAFKLVNR